ncbi:ankyrin repeat domain-containing protein 17-like, partial [Eriocheir sinensis]|uniref:ankyrin repeat domain-containing protein 17-like n=1 Tax=Eriocheir sinensis TaxID=95602 RepID=UPI0021CAD6EB
GGGADGGGPSPNNNNSENKCQAYADLQDKFFTVSGESDSEEGEESEVEPFALGEAEGEEEEGGGPGGSVRNKFLLSAAAHATAATPELGAAAHHTQPHFDPDTHSRLVALLEAADPEVLRRLTSSVSCALDEAAAALTRMRSETVGGGAAAAAATVGGSSSSSSSSAPSPVVACESGVLRSNRPLDRSCVSVKTRVPTDDIACGGVTLGMRYRTESGVTIA